MRIAWSSKFKLPFGDFGEIIMSLQQNNIDEIWEKCTSQLEKRIDTPTFEMCIKAMSPIGIEQNILKISINNFALKLLKNKPKSMTILEQTIKDNIYSEIEIKFIETDNKMEIINENQKSESVSESESISEKKSYYSSFNINPKYTFDTFVVGESNNMAFSASLAVANKPGRNYNPLFIYGGVGLGKTHLLQAIANTIAKNNPKSKIEYISMESFSTEMVKHIQENSIVKFKKKYRNVDILLIDDVQYLIGKEGTQDEFFHTFNELYEAGKHIVISSDRPPKEIPGIHDRLRSRFEWGLTVDIQQPDIETRQAILLKKAEFEKVYIPQEVIQFIAEKINTNIRELEGALIKVTARASLLNKQINLELTDQALKDIISIKEKTITPELIQQCVTNYFGIKVSDIVSSKRDKKYSYPRHIAMYITRELTNLSYLEIAKTLGKNDHTTVKHAYDKINKMIEDPSDRTKTNLENIRNNINERI